MGLERYQQKRDFTRTREPRGRTRKSGRKLAFVIHKHAATRLHYDLRLELDGVLKSWAVPKGPSLDPREKRLAMEVEDHPFDYGKFEGTIPRGEYGAGTVLVWDRGTWTPEEDPHEGLRKGNLKFRLEGEKLHGSWVLVRLSGRRHDPKKPAWLLIKHRDEHARAKGPEVTELERSVDSGRDLTEIAAREGSVWHSERLARKAAAHPRKARLARIAEQARAQEAAPAPGAVRKKVASKTPRKVAPRAQGSARRVTRGAGAKRRSRSPADPQPRAADLPGARRAPLPARLEMQLATLQERAPAGEAWLHEIKFDGYRCACRIEGARVRWITRGGKDWSERFAAMTPALRALGLPSAMLDGEIAVLGKGGATSFQELQRALSEPGGGARMLYFAFDLLHASGWDLTRVPLEERKRLLAALLAGVPVDGPLRFSRNIEGDGPQVHARACELGLEGIVSKRRNAPHRPGRGRDWIKIKCARRQEFVVTGFSAPAGARKGFGALLLGVHQGGKLRHAGRVGTGFDERTLRSLHARLRPMVVPRPPVVDPPRGAQARGFSWVRPELVAEVAFTEWTADGRVRHPSFQGLREDKAAKDVVHEQPAQGRNGAGASMAASSKGGARSGGKAGATTVGGIVITHPTRVLYAEQGLTKLDLARYYERIAPKLLPHIAGRPLSVVRCPAGPDKACFFQKHSHGTFPSAVKSVRVEESSGPAEYLMIDSLEGLIALVQMGVLELHPWGARGDMPERPDRLFFDLDPDPSVGWMQVVAAARALRERLEGLGLRSFLKTTGGKGLHVVVPLERRVGWEELKAFSRDVAMELVRAQPALYIATASKAKRSGRIFLDWLRNSRGATAVAPWSTRARPGAPISAPIAWEDLGPGLKPDAWSVGNVEKLLARREDPWEDFLRTRQSLSASMRAAVGRRPASRGSSRRSPS